MIIDRDPLRRIVGSKRVLKKFMWLPKTLNKTTIWLEYAYIYQIVDRQLLTKKHKWIDVGFVKKEMKDWAIYNEKREI